MPKGLLSTNHKEVGVEVNAFLSLLGTVAVVLASVAVVLAIAMLVVYQLHWLAKHWDWPPLEATGRDRERTTAEIGGRE
jgi:hypothetical protein